MNKLNKTTATDKLDMSYPTLKRVIEEMEGAGLTELFPGSGRRQKVDEDGLEIIRAWTDGDKDTAYHLYGQQYGEIGDVATEETKPGAGGDAAEVVEEPSTNGFDADNVLRHIESTSDHPLRAELLYDDEALTEERRRRLTNILGVTA